MDCGVLLHDLRLFLIRNTLDDANSMCVDYNLQLVCSHVKRLKVWLIAEQYRSVWLIYSACSVTIPGNPVNAFNTMLISPR